MEHGALLALLTFAAASLAGVAVAEEPASASNLPPVVSTKSTVRVWGDQLGYRPAGKKIFIVASNAPIPQDLRLDLCTANTSKVVWTLSDHAGALTPYNKGARDNESKEYLAHLDLSSVQTPGRYYVMIRDGGSSERSYQFDIGPKVYEPSATAAWRMFFFNRADIEKPEKYAGPWHAGLDHCGPNQATAAREYVWKGGPWYDAVGDKIADPTPRDVRGGWWDAGDFNKYMGNTSDCHNDLLLATQLLGDSIDDRQLNIPESGHGVPDALEEIRYGTELILRMADDTGAAYGRVHEGPSSPPDANREPVQLTARTSGATMNRAADLAYAAVVWSERKLDPAFVKQCQEAALLSWNLLGKKPHPWPVDPKKAGKEAPTGDWFEADYDRSEILAAVCLWRLTGDEKYHRRVHELSGKMNGDRELWGAYWVYLHAPNADAELTQKMKSQIFQSADSVVQHTGEHRGYAAGIDGYWWGSSRAIGQSGLNCVVAAELTSDAAARQKYIDAAEEFVHYLQGRNPLGLCYLTNMKQFGAEHSVMIMFHSWLGNPNMQKSGYGSKYIGEGPGKIGPPPGYIVGGANGGITRYNDSLNNNPWEWNEPDITYQSPCCGLLGYFGWKLR